MKIAVNSRLYHAHRGGIPYYIKLLHARLKELFPEDEILYCQPEAVDVLGRTLTLSPSSPGRIKYIFDLFWVNLLLKYEKDVDIFHGPGNSIPLLRKKGVRYVVTIHDVAFILYPEHNSWIFNLYYRWVVGRSIRLADAVVATSKNTKNDLIRVYKAEPNKIRVVYPGINDSYLTPKNTERLIRKKYIFSVTTHPRRKNIPNILQALAKAEWFADYVYVIAGVISNSQENELTELINLLGLTNQVQLFGYATEDQLHSLYAHAEFLIYPSFYEGFGLPVLEAMVCKCPVITSNTSSLVELMPDKNWLVDPNSIGDISEKMRQMISLSTAERKALADKNYNFSKEFTWEKAARAIRMVMGESIQ